MPIKSLFVHVKEYGLHILHVIDSSFKSQYRSSAALILYCSDSYFSPLVTKNFPVH